MKIIYHEGHKNMFFFFVRKKQSINEVKYRIEFNQLYKTDRHITTPLPIVNQEFMLRTPISNRISHPINLFKLNNHVVLVQQLMYLLHNWLNVPLDLFQRAIDCCDCKC